MLLVSSHHFRWSLVVVAYVVALVVTLTILTGFSGRLSGHFSFSVLADQDNLKSILECSQLMMSKWKHDHPSDIKDETLVGLMSEDEAEGKDWCEGVAR